MSDSEQRGSVGQVSPDGQFVWNGTSWVPNPQLPQPKKSHTLRNILIGVALALVLTCGGCLALVGGSLKSLDTSKTTTTTTTEPGTPAKAVTPQPLFASKYLRGDAKPSLPAGAKGKIAVIAQAPLDKVAAGGFASLPFVFRNNTDESVGSVSWTATARVGGKLIATGSDQGSIPAVIAPGEVGLAYIYFDAGASIPDSGVKFEFKATGRPVDAILGPAPLVIGEYERNGGQFIGSATNKTKKEISGPISVSIYCFDGSNLGTETRGFAEENSVAPGEDANFTVTVYDPCKTFVMAVDGH